MSLLIKKPDLYGMLASGLCMVHCIATPFLFALQPLSAQYESAPIWWKRMDYFFLLVSLLAVYWSTKHTTKNWIKYALWISFLLLTIGILNEKFEVFHWSALTIYILAIALVVLHFYNTISIHTRKKNVS